MTTTQTFNIQEAKTRLSSLLQAVASGTEVIIAKAGKPMARLSRIEESRPQIRFGVLKVRLRYQTILTRHYQTISFWNSRGVNAALNRYADFHLGSSGQ